MANFEIKSRTRSESGKGVSRKLRAAGEIPAIMYGRKQDPVGLVVDESAIRDVLHAHPESAIVDLNVDGGAFNAIVRDVQRHPATGKILHVDFQRISLDEKVRIEVPVQVSGVADGVKNHGGILEHSNYTVNVNCLPSDIPEAIEIDVTHLGVHDHIRLGDIVGNYPKLDFLDDLDSSLAAVFPPAVEVVVTEEEGADAVAGEADAAGAPAEDQSKDKD